jgi:hypothetical protein
MLQEAMRAREREGDPNAPASHLALSGRSDNGAFGAGVLTGWSERGDRPTFKLVTGISTGALIAPFAFLGQAYDPQLHTVYTQITPDDLYEDALDVVCGLQRCADDDRSAVSPVIPLR